MSIVNTFSITISAPFSEAGFLVGEVSDVVHIFTEIKPDINSIVWKPFDPCKETEAISTSLKTSFRSDEQNLDQCPFGISMSDIEAYDWMAKAFAKHLFDQSGVDWEFPGLKVTNTNPENPVERIGGPSRWRK